MDEQPRGIRNNNPGNIRKSQTHWLGEVFPGSDKDFCTFSYMHLGVRAAGLIFLNYQREHALYTPAQMIGRWAPTNENDTAAYISAVCHEAGLVASKAYTFSKFDKDIFAAFLHAVFYHENGDEYVKEADLFSGVVLALQ